MSLGDETKDRAEMEYTSLDQLTEALGNQKASLQKELKDNAAAATEQIALLQEQLVDWEAGKDSRIDRCDAVLSDVAETKAALRKFIDAEDEAKVTEMLDGPEHAGEVCTVPYLKTIVGYALDGTADAPG